MFRNYLKSAWRNFRKNRLLSLITFGGLSIGIAAVLLIGMYLYAESGYDSFQKNKFSIYRVGFHFWDNGKSLGEGSKFVAAFGPDAQNEFPGIGAFTRVSGERVAYLSYGEKTIKVENIHHADSSFFEMFSYKLLKGNPSVVLKEPYSIVLNAETAEKLFGTEDAVGKIVRLDNQEDFLVTGIAEQPPANSHLDFNALLSFSTLYKETGNYMGWDGGEQYSVYLQVKPGVDAVALNKKLPGFMWKHINQAYASRGFKIDASLQPLRDIHLLYDDDSRSLRTNLYVFSIIAVLILVISCVNYVNLTTAQAISRFREVGVRKVLGAGRRQLTKQFLLETALVTSTAFFMGLILVKLLTPSYQDMIGRKLPAIAASDFPALLLLFTIIMLIGMIAGSYIAFYLSSFNVTRIFKALLPGGIQSRFKKGLIVAQFTITIALAACTILITMQLRFSKNHAIGFDKDHVLVLPLVGEGTQDAASQLEHRLLQIPSIRQVSALSEIPYDGITNNGFVPEGSSKAMLIHQLDADNDFLKTFNIKMSSGEFFSKEKPTLKDGLVINETLAKELGWKNPLGKIISRDGDHRVIGVIKDFHFASLHDRIEPLIITNRPWENRFSYLAVKYYSTNTSVFLEQVKNNWKAATSNAPFDYWFLDEAFNNVYKSEERFQLVFIYFSGLSILLSLAGVFGLVALSIRQRMKEFGIRKVLGAGLFDMLRLTTRDFAWLILVGATIATPISWYYMSKWLENFAYRVPVSFWVFAVCGLGTLLLTLLIISFQTARATVANPVKSLRTE